MVRYGSGPGNTDLLRRGKYHFVYLGTADLLSKVKNLGFLAKQVSGKPKLKEKKELKI